MANTLKLGAGKWATGKDTLMSFNDENGNFKPLPFSFSRASGATVVNQSGLIETVGSGEPRIDFLGNTKGALLLEPSRTNLTTYSQDFSQSVWGTWQSTKTLSNNINPKGTNGYYEISHTGSSSDNPNTRLTNVSLNGSYTLSFFVKINQSRYISLSIEDYDGDRAKVYFDTINKTFTTISNVGSPITNTSYSEFSNDWIRISLSVNLLNAVYNEVGIGIYNPSGSFPSASGEVISVFGSQLEVGSYPTSYITTSGSAVTRVAESCYQGGLLDKGVLNNTALTLFFNSTLTSDTTNQYLEVINLYNLSNGNKIRLETRTNNIIHVQQSGVVNSGDNFNSASLGSNSINFKKIAIVLTQTQFKIFANGNQINTTYNGSYNVNLNSLGFRGDNNSVETKIQNKEIKLYNTALTDQELIALTQE